MKLCTQAEFTFLMEKKDPIGSLNKCNRIFTRHEVRPWLPTFTLQLRGSQSKPLCCFGLPIFFPSLRSVVHQVLMDVPKHSFFCITNYQEHCGSLIMSSNWIEAGAKYLRWSGHWQEGLSASFSIRNQHVSRLLELLCTYWLMAIIYYSAEDLALS